MSVAGCGFVPENAAGSDTRVELVREDIPGEWLTVPDHGSFSFNADGTFSAHDLPRVLFADFPELLPTDYPPDGDIDGTGRWSFGDVATVESTGFDVVFDTVMTNVSHGPDFPMAIQCYRNQVVLVTGSIALHHEGLTCEPGRLQPTRT
jgi:hypothetical protein